MVPAAVAAWICGGVLVGVRDATVVALVCAGLWVVAVAAVAFAGRDHAWAGSLVVALVAAAVVATAVIAAGAVREPPALLDAADRSGAVSATIAVTGRPDDGRMKGTVIAVESTTTSAPVLLFAAHDDPRVANLRIGDTVSVTGGVQRSDAGDDVAFLVFAHDDLRVVATSSGAVGGAAAMRERFSAVAAGLPGPGAGLLPGLAIGDTSAIAPALDADMTTSSLSHLTAVSGSNCAIVVGLVFALAAGIGLSRWARVVVAGAALAGFVVLVTPEPSVVRAAAMAAIALGALAVSRPGRGIPLLCLAVIVLLITDPWLSRSYGFALSVLATAGLLVLAAPIAARLGRWLPRWIALLIAVPLSAQLACQPVLLLLDPALPVYGVVANLLAEPAAPLATVIGLVSCLLATLAPPLAPLVAGVAWLPASWIAAVASFTAGLPGARSPWPTGTVGVVLLVVLSVAAVVVLVGAGPLRLRVAARAVVVVAVIAYLATLAGGRLVTELGRPTDWEFAQCDVGQGDAVLVRNSGVVALIDTGPLAEPLAACLDELGIDRIQLLVLTHYDLDHVGGVDAVVGRVDRVLIGPPSDAGDERIAAALTGGGAEVQQVARGERGTIGRLDWRVLWPPTSGVEPGNAASVTLEVTPGPGCVCLSGVFLGDLGEESQARLQGSDPPGLVDVVKVAHHGSADQSAALYESIAATVGLIGVGADNDYGHPTQSLLDVLTAVGTAAFRSDRDGLVLVAPAGDADGGVRVWTERGSGSGGVMPDG